MNVYLSSLILDGCLIDRILSFHIEIRTIYVYLRHFSTSIALVRSVFRISIMRSAREWSLQFPFSIIHLAKAENTLSSIFFRLWVLITSVFLAMFSFTLVMNSLISGVIDLI